MKTASEVAKEIVGLLNLGGHVKGPNTTEAILAEVLRRERKEQREEICKAVCPDCRRGSPLHATGMHEIDDSHYEFQYPGSKRLAYCPASAIRAKGED